MVMTRAQLAKKPEKSDILTNWRVNPKVKINRNANQSVRKMTHKIYTLVMMEMHMNVAEAVNGAIRFV